MSSADSSVEIEGDIRGACGVSISSGLDNKTVDNLEILQSLSPSSDLSMSSDVSTEEESPTSENQFDNVEQIDQRHINEDETDKIDACNKKSQKNLSARKTDPVVESSVGSLTPDGHGKKTGTRRGTETFLEENLELSTPDDNGLLTGRKPTSKCKLFKKSKGFLRKKRRSPRAVFYKVFATRARNISFGGHQIIQSSEQDVREVEKTSCTEPTRPRRNSRVKRLLESTERDIEWTSNMVKTSCVSEIVKKIGNHVNWITITGNAGDGKTTTGYLVLGEMVKRGKEVFHVKETDQYYIVTENTKNSVIMLNDVFGAFAFDHTAMSKWEPVIHDALDNITRSKETGHSSNITVIFVSRINVLQGAKCKLGKYAKYFFEKDYVFNLGTDHKETDTERLKMVEYHLQRINICDISETEKRRIVSCVSPHGFPHCCKMYAEMRSRSEDVNIEAFFTSPVGFLDETIRHLTDEDGNRTLFKLLLAKDGKADISGNEYGAFRQTASSLVGSYLTDNYGIISFSHPSIRVSVAHCIASRDVLFAAENFNLSFLIQKVRFADISTKGNEGLSSELIYIPPSKQNIEKIYVRFLEPIIYRNFDVLQHNFFLNYEFCDKVISSVISRGSRLFRRGFLGRNQTHKLPIDERNQNGFALLHIAVRNRNPTAVKVLLKHGAKVDVLTNTKRTCLQIHCNRPDVDVDILTILLRNGADVNKAVSTGCTPLHGLCQLTRPNEAALGLVLKHHASVDKEDMYGCTPLHYLCRNAETADTIDLLISHGADVNKVDEEGCLPLHYLCQNDNVNEGIIDLLISQRAEVNKTTNSGLTPLHYLCSNEKVDGGIITSLISSGAGVNVCDRRGYTPLHCLCRNEKANKSIVDLMITRGADKDKVDSKGFTPLHYLRQRNQCPQN